MIGNLLPVAIDNIFGGGFMIAAVYWFTYRRAKVGKTYGPKQVVEFFVGAPANQDPPKP